MNRIAGHLKGYFGDFLNLLYPKICISCSNALVKQEEQLCLKCIIDLPRTNFHFVSSNPIEQLLWGRTQIEKATALFFYRKGSRFQPLLHQLKYKGNYQLGIELGKIMGAEVSQLNYYGEVDYIVPVPLHPKKEKKRGYNQSLMIANGLSEILNKPIVTNNLIRVHYNETQTKRGRFERWENVSDLFQITNLEEFENKHLLLVDDVITTGSTLEACTNALLKSSNVKVSIAALAFASI
jgi:ComF family protein